MAQRQQQPEPSAEVAPVAGFIAAAPEDLGFESEFTEPVGSREEKISRLAQMDAKEVKPCVLCRLCETRRNTVFGEGDPDAKIFFIGEGPGENEDLQGRPFVGRAGELAQQDDRGHGFAPRAGFHREHREVPAA